MVGILVLGLLLQALLLPFSRFAALFPGAFAALILLLVSVGPLVRGGTVSFFGLGLPPLVGLVLGLVWLAACGWGFVHFSSAGTGSAVRGLVAGFGKAALLCLVVVVLMAILVLPLVILANALPTLFTVVTLAGVLVLFVWMLRRKYRNMARLDISDTRRFSRDEWPTLRLRWLFRALIRPVLIAIVCLVYVYGLLLLNTAPLVGGSALIALTLLLMWTARILRSLPWMDGSD